MILLNRFRRRPAQVILLATAATWLATLDNSLGNSDKVIIRSSYTPTMGVIENAQPAPSASAKKRPTPTAYQTRPGPVTPTPLLNFTPRHGWKTNIVATVFWIGEQPTQNNPVPNHKSSWDTKWMQNYGGYDDPDVNNRCAGYRPATFIPKLNPFYVALPYNDVLNHEITKAEAAQVIPWFKQTFKRHGKSVCHNRWIAIRHGSRVAYAQWSDCGPFLTDDAAYVFGTAPPRNSMNNGAGIDLSPAVRDYLGFISGKRVDWCFVEESEVPDGPWKAYGSNNPFSKSWVKDPEPIFAGAFVPKKQVASASRSQPGKNTRKSSNGLPGFTLKKVRKSDS